METYLKSLEEALGAARGKSGLPVAIVNAPFSDHRTATLLGLGIMVYLRADNKTGMINREALSDTDLAKGTVDASVKPFKSIKIPLDYKGNFIAEAIRSGRYQQTSDWQYLFAPSLTREEARINQAAGGIGCSFVYPLEKVPEGGALIYSYFINLDKVDSMHRTFMFRYTKAVSRILSGES